MCLLSAVPTFVTHIAPSEGANVEGTFIVKSTSRYLAIQSGDISLLLSLQISTPSVEDVLTCLIAPSQLGLGDTHILCSECWCNRPGMTRDRRAFATFGLDMYPSIRKSLQSLIVPKDRTSCGKSLALIEIRIVLASLLSAFRICLTPDDNGEAVERAMRDQSTGSSRDLNLIFQPHWSNNTRKLLDMVVVTTRSKCTIILVQIQQVSSSNLSERHWQLYTWGVHA